MDRRSSDNEASRRPTSPDVFDDDHEIDPNEDDFMPSVSDGFRPTNTSEAWNSDRQNHDRISIPQRQTSTSKPHDKTDLRRTATRNSTAKVRDPIPQDSRQPLNRGPSHHSPLGHRDSVSSTSSFATTSNSENPFETGPSHPYGMYPQLSMARPLSVATSSTERQPHRSMSLQRPTHPYAMYSQSGIVDEEPPEEQPAQPPVPQVQSSIPVGFPGLDNGYRRVLGPDGEEQDIIGPDGHTEQLPPYSRFPEEGPTKASLAAEASASRIVPAPLQVDPEDPFNTPASPTSPLGESSSSASALPVAPLLPSVTPARLPPQRPETQTGNLAPANSASAQSGTVPAEASESSSASLLASENHFSEKAEPAEEKVDWRKRKLFGKVPVGLALIILLITLVFTIALGAAVGTFVANKKKNDPGPQRPAGPSDEAQPQVIGQNGSLFDAVPISAPAGLTPLPTGSYALPLGIPQESNPGCLTQASQYSAWSCKMTFAPLVITINDTIISDETIQVASMSGGPSVPNKSILYGLQSPVLDMKPMELVLDLDYRAYGPAYHFSARYDKLVILPPEELNLGAGLTKRADVKYRQRFQVKPGDYPWFCYWNSTYIEGYIYSEDNSTAASFTSFPTQWPTPTPSTADMSGTSAVTVAAATVSTSSSSQSSSTQPAAVAATASSAPLIPAIPIAGRESSPEASSPPRMPPYPRIVKVEERRLPNSPQPYCQQMLLLDNGEITPAPSPNDSPIRIWLQESDPSYQQYFAAQSTEAPPSGSRSKRQTSPRIQRRSDPPDACHCQWMFK
ncbi:hypothetical protein CFE70_009691 [Pyrenophora teres f. teres 0-1]|uniref:DUF7820 domain-containing protein n=2 Tax=Pyrenophora teres f. teres TaxID=97479 RepID=E3RWK2_PYRTT|nr:hypothetical protein PTT_13678 [Pyrenophora teres f. teres 0-1]KAE8827096.1 hypothetical protein HRS9139_08268 [Pyrenophora teres f. teres]KAE8832614.1 hypothetical protein PTNB85_07006 [Pyrenophora teres f. teres]KAE8856275.1 hypothetical protein PTNB29_09114 [Pyrenophora teres f. teres]CAE7213791.1 hypothetical protein PTTW11_10459 [Pyrenophora teres f. teres]